MTPFQKAEPRVALYGASRCNKGGTGVYTRRLIKGFDLIGADSVVPLGDPGSNWMEKLVSENFRIPGRVRKEGFDLLHFPAFSGTSSGGVPYAVTIHDMAFMECPGWFPALRSLYYRMHFPRIARGASVIIADSGFTAGEIKKHLGLESRKVYLSSPLNNTEENYFRDRYSIPGEYILYTGTVEPRKNIGNLLEAWPQVRRIHGNLLLVVAGRWGWGASSLKDRLNNTDGVLWTGSIPDKLLRSAMTGARMLVYPSLYEGFGLPPLESAASGTPFVIGPAETLKEIYGSVAAGITGKGPESISSTILDALEKQYSTDSLRDFAMGFSLEATARNTLECYRSVFS